MEGISISSCGTTSSTRKCASPRIAGSNSAGSSSSSASSGGGGSGRVTGLVSLLFGAAQHRVRHLYRHHHHHHHPFRIQLSAAAVLKRPRSRLRCLLLVSFAAALFFLALQLLRTHGTLQWNLRRADVYLHNLRATRPPPPDWPALFFRRLVRISSWFMPDDCGCVPPHLCPSSSNRVRKWWKETTPRRTLLALMRITRSTLPLASLSPSATPGSYLGRPGLIIEGEPDGFERQQQHQQKRGQEQPGQTPGAGSRSMLPQPQLSEAQAEALGVPCSATWRAHVEPFLSEQYRKLSEGRSGYMASMYKGLLTTGCARLARLERGLEAAAAGVQEESAAAAEAAAQAGWWWVALGWWRWLPQLERQHQGQWWPGWSSEAEGWVGPEERVVEGELGSRGREGESEEKQGGGKNRELVGDAGDGGQQEGKGRAFHLGHGAMVEMDLDAWGSCWPNSLPMSPSLETGELWSRKFLVTGFLDEQLSKAKVHLSELARLAVATGRVLVLPRASKSRLTIEREHPMCIYHDLEQLNKGGVDWISPDLFLLLLARYKSTQPSTAYLCLELAALNRPCIYWATQEMVLPETLMHAYWELPGEHNIARVEVPWQPETDPAVALRILSNWSTVDVVVVLKTSNANLHYEEPDSYSLADVLLPYSPQIVRWSRELISQHLPRPLVALHYRSEFVVWTMVDEGRPDEIIPQIRRCTRGAAALVQEVVARTGARSVFIAADIPWNRTTGHERSESWSYFVETYGKERCVDAPYEGLQYLRSKVPMAQMVDELDPRANDVDQGITSLLDKLVCAQADTFVAAILSCGGERAFYGDIMRMRSAFGMPWNSTSRWEASDDVSPLLLAPTASIPDGEVAGAAVSEGRGGGVDAGGDRPSAVGDSGKR